MLNLTSYLNLDNIFLYNDYNDIGIARYNNIVFEQTAYNYSV